MVIRLGTVAEDGIAPVLCDIETGCPLGEPLFQFEGSHPDNHYDHDSPGQKKFDDILRIKDRFVVAVVDYVINHGTNLGAMDENKDIISAEQELRRVIAKTHNIQLPEAEKIVTRYSSGIKLLYKGIGEKINRMVQDLDEPSRPPPRR